MRSLCRKIKIYFLFDKFFGLLVRAAAYRNVYDNVFHDVHMTNMGKG